MAGVRRNGARGGGRSSGGCGVSAAACKRASCHASVTPRVVASATDARAGPFGHRGFAGDEPVRRSVSAPVEGAARGRISQRGMGKTMQRLTAVLLVLLARQGRHGVRRIDGGELRWPATERRWWRRCRASGGPWVGGEEGGGRGGAPWGVGEAWGARWLRQSASVAAAPLGSEVRSERESRRRG